MIYVRFYSYLKILKKNEIETNFKLMSDLKIGLSYTEFTIHNIYVIQNLQHNNYIDF